MICRRVGFIIQCHNELCDLKAEMLNIVCHEVEIELVLQDVTRETLPDAGVNIHAWVFWVRQSFAFFDVRVCHPNADS